MTIWTSRIRQSPQPSSEFRRWPRPVPIVGRLVVQDDEAARAAVVALGNRFGFSGA
jgi:hypothetical protein